MFRKTHNNLLSVETLLFGKSGLSDNSNFVLFQAVQQYIKTWTDLHVDFHVSSGELGSHLHQLVVLPGWASSDILFHMFCFELVTWYFSLNLFFLMLMFGH